MSLASGSNSGVKFYDFLGARYDWLNFFEARAKARGIEQLQLSPGLEVLHAGTGPGRDQVNLEQEVSPGGRITGFDLSRNMLRAARDRARDPLLQADIRRLPFASSAFDRLFSAYVLDLIPDQDLPALLRDFYRVLRPGGRVSLVGLTEGIDATSRAVISTWMLAYQLNPLVCGNCKPRRLSEKVRQAGFTRVEREVVVQMGVPSEIVTAGK